MIYLTVVLTVREQDDIPFVRATMAELGKLAKLDQGCVRFEVYHSQSDKRVFFLNEMWTDAASLDAHRQTKAFVETYMKQVVPKLERAPHPCDLLV